MDVRGILADINVQGLVRSLVLRMSGEPWRELWEGLAIQSTTIPEIGLPRDASDRDVWQACQQQQFVLITSNRNADGPDALETTIRQLSSPTSLPVITIAAVRRVQVDHAYREQIIERLLEVLYSIDALRGTGRIYLP